MLVTSFDALGLILASLGIYGVVSYSITRQTRRSESVWRSAPQLVVYKEACWQKLRLTMMGIVIGAMVAFVFGRAITSMLYNTEAGDPWTFVNMTFLLAEVALLAGHLPARRASRINPMVALRNN